MKNRKTVRVITVILISVCFCLVNFLWGSFCYVDGDDYTLNLICAGAYDTQLREYLIFSNVVYGKIIGLLYKAFPGLNMYLLTMIILNCLSVISICYSACEGFWGRRKVEDNKNVSKVYLMDFAMSALITTVINLCLAEDTYINLQFTQNAGLYTAAGIALLIVWICSGHSLKRPEYVFSIILLFMGYCVRQDSFLAVLAVACCGFGVWVLLNIRNVWHAFVLSGNSFFKYKQQIIVFFLIGISIISAFLINKKAYDTDEWREYHRYNNARSMVLDFYFPAYVDNPSFYNELGLDEIDVILLRQWCYVDPDKYTLDVMEKISQLSLEQHDTSFRVDIDVIISTLANIKNGFMHVGVPTGLLLLLIICICKRRFELLWVYCALLFGVFCEYYYFTLIGRVLWRMEYLTWLSAAVTFLVMLSWTVDNSQEESLIRPSQSIALGLVSVVLISICFGSLYFNYVQVKGRELFPDHRANDGVYSYLAENNDNYYLVSAFLTNGLVPRINNPYTNRYSNITFTGGWSVPSPLWTKHFEERGINNPIKSLVTHDGNYYLVDNSGLQELLRQYLEKEMGQPVVVEQVDSIYGIPIWKFGIQ